MMPLNFRTLLARLVATLSLLVVMTISGCVYHVDIQQGNKLDQDDIDQVQPGMTRSQVRYVLGSPVINDTFHPDRWDYMYYFLPGRARKADQRWVRIDFVDGRVSEIQTNIPVDPS